MTTDNDVYSLDFPFGRELMTWWCVVRHYDTDDAAKRAFDTVNVHAARLHGKAEIAGYRVMDALPAGNGKPRTVVIIGMKEGRVREAARLLGGNPCGMHHGYIVSLVKRRIRFLMNARDLGTESGVYLFEHGKSGMWIDETGKVVPPRE